MQDVYMQGGLHHCYTKQLHLLRLVTVDSVHRLFECMQWYSKPLPNIRRTELPEQTNRRGQTTLFIKLHHCVLRNVIQWHSDHVQGWRFDPTDALQPIVSVSVLTVDRRKYVHRSYPFKLESVAKLVRSTLQPSPAHVSMVNGVSGPSGVIAVKSATEHVHAAVSVRHLHRNAMAKFVRNCHIPESIPSELVTVPRFWKKRTRNDAANYVR